MITLTACGGGSEGETEPEVTVSGMTPSSTHTPVDFGLTEESASIRLTPEQIRQQFVKATGYEHSTESNWLLQIFHTQLGGVDFDEHSKRDFSISTESMVTLELISYAFAQHLVFSELSKPAADRVFFTEASIVADKPYAGEQLERWNAQMTEVYWAFFSRPPEVEELEMLRESFNQFYEFDYEPYDLYRTETYKMAKSWSLVLTVLFSSMEFWNV